MAEIHSRMATIDDARLIAQHRHRMFADADGGTADSRAEMDKHFPGWLARHQADGSYLHWFACDGEKIIAGAGLWLMDWAPGFNGFDGYLPYILNVYTEPDYRKQGLARQLVNDTLQYCRDEGYPKVRLHASI